MYKVIFILVFISLSSYYFHISNSLEQFFQLAHSPPNISEIANNGKIFVSIASYRDSEVVKTVQSLLKNAEMPELLRIVVYEQNGDGDIELEPMKNVEIIKDHYTKARGPVWARYLIQQRYDGEEYYMQIDSHMRVIKNWDTELKNMLNMLPEMSVLTQYPCEYNIKDGSYDKDEVRSGLYIQGFGVNDRMTRIQSDIVKSDLLRVKYPYTSKAWSACFSFSRGNLVKDVPYDPYLPYLFFGEELDITLRLYTHGWNFYSPYKSVIYTTFNRAHRRTYWQDFSMSTRLLFEGCSRKRLCKRLGTEWVPNYIGIIPLIPWVSDESLLKDSDKYSLGNKRSIRDYEKFAEIKCISMQKMSNGAKTFRRYTTRPLFR